MVTYTKLRDGSWGLRAAGEPLSPGACVRTVPTAAMSAATTSDPAPAAGRQEHDTDE